MNSDVFSGVGHGNLDTSRKVAGSSGFQEPSNPKFLFCRDITLGYDISLSRGYIYTRHWTNQITELSVIRQCSGRGRMISFRDTFREKQARSVFNFLNKAPNKLVCFLSSSSKTQSSKSTRAQKHKPVPPCNMCAFEFITYQMQRSSCRK